MNLIILPEVLVGEIYDFISLKNLAKCNKYYFNKYYLQKNKKKEIIKQSYFRFLLRNDMNFIFEKYININFRYFIKKKKLNYNNKIFPRKIELLTNELSSKESKMSNLEKSEIQLKNEINC